MNNNSKFVILKHTRTDQPTHWDLMFENGSILDTYRFESPPENLSYQPNTAIRIVDHPLRFLNYEGPVNKGLGKVTVADAGTFRIIENTENCMKLHIEGKILSGQFSLTRTEQDICIFKKESFGKAIF